jgi:quercetin dioxygenase-like cupin family protein
MHASKMRIHRKAQPGFRWEEVDCAPYKDDEDAPFKAVTRQVLFSDEALDGELRYFEVAPGGYSTLERHEHAHAVLILRGTGRCLVGGAVYDVAERDLVSVPSMAWHQFRASASEPLGFLCLVNARRDKPQRPCADDVARLQSIPTIAAFLRGGAGTEPRERGGTS